MARTSSSSGAPPVIQFHKSKLVWGGIIISGSILLICSAIRSSSGEKDSPQSPVSIRSSAVSDTRTIEFDLSPNYWSPWIDVQYNEGAVVDSGGWHEYYFWNGERMFVPKGGRAFFDNLRVFRTQHRSFCIRGAPGKAKIVIERS